MRRLNTGMNFFKPFKAIGKFFKNVFSKKTLAAIESTLNKVGPIVQVALPVVRQIAALTPMRTDDEILRLLDHYGITKVVTAENRAIVLRDVAVEALKTKYNLTDQETSMLNLAVELAVQTMKEEKAKTT